MSQMYSSTGGSDQDSLDVLNQGKVVKFGDINANLNHKDSPPVRKLIP